MDETCTCGDVYDEHDVGGGECLVDSCGCAAFELDPDPDA